MHIGIFCYPFYITSPPIFPSLPLCYLSMVIPKAPTSQLRNSSDHIGFRLKIPDYCLGTPFLFIAILQICKDPEFLKILEFYLTPLRKFLLVSLGILGNE